MYKHFVLSWNFRKLPQKTSLGQLRGNSLRSCRGTTTPSMLPNIVERPRQKSMTKKRTAQRGETGILMMASVNTMKARPVPSTPWRRTHQIFLPLTLSKTNIHNDRLINSNSKLSRFDLLTWLRNFFMSHISRFSPSMILGLVRLRCAKTSW